MALALVDEAVSYIQADYAQDPCQFYYGTKRSLQVRTDGTLNQRSYARLKQEPAEAVPAGEAAQPQVYEEAQMDDEKAMPMSAVASGAAGAPSSRRQMSPKKEASETVKDTSFAYAKMKAPARAPEQPAPEAGSVIVVRQDFRATAFWQPDIQTGTDGQAKVTVKYPDSLTSWKAVGRAVTTGNQFGLAQATTRTKLPLIVRLQAPRFFLTQDQVTISAVVSNNTDKNFAVRTSLTAKGLKAHGAESQVIRVPANSEARADWEVDVQEPGEAMLKVEARSGAFSDAMEKAYPIYEHGLEKSVTKAGKVRGSESVVTLDLPRERKPESTALTLQVAPSLAVALLDSLPYLFDYPYGCTEQTLSRFLPAVIVAKTLQDFKVKPEPWPAKCSGA